MSFVMPFKDAFCQWIAAEAFASAELGLRMMKGNGISTRTTRPITQKEFTKASTLDCRSTCAESCANARRDASLAFMPIAIKF